MFLLYLALPCAARLVPCATRFASALHVSALRVPLGARMLAKSAKKDFRNPHNLPVKDCVVCGRPFTWRKKWERDWDTITTCSKRCNSERKKNNRAARADDDSSGSDEEPASSTK